MVVVLVVVQMVNAVRFTESIDDENEGTDCVFGVHHGFWILQQLAITENSSSRYLVKN